MKARVPSADSSAAARPASPATVRDFTDFKPEQRPEPTEWELRQQLAAAYRIVAYFGWDYLIYGHLSVRVPGPERHFLINPFGLMYDEVTASNLVKIDLDGNLVEPGPYTVNPAGFVIHGAIHAARPDAHCVMHTHTIAGMTLAAADVPVRAIDFAGASLHVSASPITPSPASTRTCPTARRWCGASATSITWCCAITGSSPARPPSRSPSAGSSIWRSPAGCRPPPPR